MQYSCLWALVLLWCEVFWTGAYSNFLCSNIYFGILNRKEDGRLNFELFLSGWAWGVISGCRDACEEFWTVDFCRQPLWGEDADPVDEEVVRELEGLLKWTLVVEEEGLTDKLKTWKKEKFEKYEYYDKEDWLSIYKK